MYLYKYICIYSHIYFIEKQFLNQSLSLPVTLKKLMTDLSLCRLISN